jgi:hypothetical protein
MHEREKSDSAVIAVKPTKRARPLRSRWSVIAEPCFAWTAGTKRNAGKQSTHRAQCRERVSQALQRVRQAATLCRQALKVRAVCGKSACTDLWGAAGNSRPYRERAESVRAMLAPDP